jgi:hypothetical protein
MSLLGALYTTDLVDIIPSLQAYSSCLSSCQPHGNGIESLARQKQENYYVIFSCSRSYMEWFSLLPYRSSEGQEESERHRQHSLFFSNSLDLAEFINLIAGQALQDTTSIVSKPPTPYSIWPILQPPFSSFS